MARVSDLVLDVKRKLANRQDADALAPFWIRDSVREITDSIPFTELEIFGPDLAFTTGTAVYDVNNFINENDEVSSVVGFEVFMDYPTNKISRMILYKEPMAIRPMSRISGIPVYWSRFSDKFIIANNPDKPYATSMMYQRKHPFIAENLAGQTLLIPDSWLEIVVFASALRGAMELRLADYITMYHQVLHGDPEKPDQPGLLKARMTQHQRDKGMNQGQVVPTVGRYSAR